MIDFVQKQLEASERPFKLMVDDHKERTVTLQMWAEINEGYQKKLEDRDRLIEELRARLAVYEKMDSM